MMEDKLSISEVLSKYTPLSDYKGFIYCNFGFAEVDLKWLDKMLGELPFNSLIIIMRRRFFTTAENVETPRVDDEINDKLDTAIRKNEVGSIEHGKKYIKNNALYWLVTNYQRVNSVSIPFEYGDVDEYLDEEFDRLTGALNAYKEYRLRLENFD